ncbi:hypothetical protein AB6D66_25950 [Vibrio pomeroyi]|uniref:Uncharacterized protein n=1 Tax=Vibrio pomeroyi TaxID=198832 RepID=A0ABV4N5I1_9VIBR
MQYPKAKRTELNEEELKANQLETNLTYTADEIESILDRDNVERRRKIHANLLLKIKSGRVSEF